MFYQFSDGDKVRVIRNVRNDGTYPGKCRGDLLIKRGSIGYVIDVGTFLQDQIIYSVHFLDENIVVGCREEELIDGEESWTPSRFEFRDKVATLIPLAVQGEIVVSKGEVGEVLKIRRDETSNEVVYHVHFAGKNTFIVPENALQLATFDISEAQNNL